MNFAVLSDHRVILKENQKKDKYLDIARELRKTVEYESDGYNNCCWYSRQKTGRKIGGLENEKTSEEHPNYCIIAIGQILIRVLETWEDCCHSNSSEKPSANAGVKKIEKV